MAETDYGWMLVEQANKAKEKSSDWITDSLTDGETDQEFEVVKEGISPPKYLPLLQLSEDHYANEQYTDDGSDIEVLKPKDKDSPVLLEPCSDASWVDEDNDDWFTVGYQGNFNNVDSSDDESYGLVELFHNHASYNERRDSCGLVCEVDWQPRSKTSPVVILILLGVSVGIAVIGNRATPSAVEHGMKTEPSTISAFDIVVLSTRLNSSINKYQKLQAKYGKLEQINKEVVKRLRFMKQVLDIWRNQSDGKTEKINSLQEMIWFQKNELHKCQKHLGELQSNISMSDDKTFEAPSFKQCLTMITDSFPTLNISGMSVNNSKTKRIFDKVAKHVNEAKKKLKGKISLFNKNVVTTWKHVTDKWQNYKERKGSKKQKKYAKSRDSRQNEKQFQKLLDMSNILNSHEKPVESINGGIESRSSYCHLRADVAKNVADFKNRWQEEPDYLDLMYPQPLNPPGFVSSKPEKLSFVDWSHVDTVQDQTDGYIELGSDLNMKGNYKSNDLKTQEAELNSKKQKLYEDRIQFEEWKNSEMKNIKKLKQKVESKEKILIKKEKSYFKKLVKAYDRKIARANKRLKKKKDKFDHKLKNLQKLFTIVLKKRLDNLGHEKLKTSKLNRKFNSQHKKFNQFMNEKENVLRQQTKLVSQYKSRYHDLEIKLDVLQRLHNNLRSQYANLKLKQSQSYEDLVFDRKPLKLSDPHNDLPDDDVEVEEWFATVSCPLQDGCQNAVYSHDTSNKLKWDSNTVTRDYTQAPTSQLTYIKPTLSYPGRHTLTTHTTTPNGITPSPPTKHFDFSLLGSSTAFICNKSSEVFHKSKKYPTVQASPRIEPEKPKALWYFDMMEEREHQRSVPLSWYLYWAQGRQEIRQRDESDAVKDWYTTMMNERENLRTTPSTWYYNWMKNRATLRKTNKPFQRYCSGRHCFF